MPPLIDSSDENGSRRLARWDCSHFGCSLKYAAIPAFSWDMYVARFLLGSAFTAGVLAACSSDIPSGNIPFAALIFAEAGASAIGTDSADGGDSSADGGRDDSASHAVGGTVTGLAAGDSIVLENNAAGDITVSANGVFTFGSLPAGSAYAVTVKTAPTTNKYCGVHDSAGTVGSADVAITVTCAATPTVEGAYDDRGQTGLVAGSTLIGNKVTLTASSITAFGSIGRSASAHIKMALYTDSAGMPSKLVVGTVGTTTVNGRLEIPVTATVVPAGDYWVMAVYDSALDYSYGQQSTNTTTASASQTYASALPATFPTSGSSYSGGTINYYVLYQ